MKSLLWLAVVRWPARFRKLSLTTVAAAVALVGGVGAAIAVGHPGSTHGPAMIAAERGHAPTHGSDAVRIRLDQTKAAREAAIRRAARSRIEDPSAAATRAAADVSASGAATDEAAGSPAAGQAAGGQAAKETAVGRPAKEAAVGRTADKRASKVSKVSKARAHRRPAWVLPLASYHLTGRFGQSGSNWSMFHHGLDFAAPTGTPIRAVGRGTIVASGWDGAYGNRIEIRHPDGTETLYGHMSRLALTAGQVQPGTVIGYVGSTGNVTGPHVHLEVRPHGGGLDDAVDPFPWLTEHGLHP